MFTVRFWKDAVERAVRTVAQVLLSLIVVGETGFMDVDWLQALSIAGLAGLASVLMSLVATGIGDKKTSSFVKDEQ